MLSGLTYEGSISCDDDSSFLSTTATYLLLGLGIGAITICVYHGLSKWAGGTSTRDEDRAIGINLEYREAFEEPSDTEIYIGMND